MCLGLPGQIVDEPDLEEHRATVEVSGVRRAVNIGLLVTDGETVAAGDWVLVHVGFAMAKIDEDEAQRTLELIRDMEGIFEDELADFGGSPG